MWLGLSRRNFVWEEIGYDGTPVPSKSTYFNWTNPVIVDYHSPPCSFMLTDGSWNVAFGSCTDVLKLCTVCSVTEPPIFTMKGLCRVSNVDFNFYLANNENREVFYEGYKDGLLVKKRGRWMISDRTDLKLNFSIP